MFAVADIPTEIIAASVRHPMHVTQCALAGADIATVPYAVLEKMTQHPLTDAVKGLSLLFILQKPDIRAAHFLQPSYLLICILKK